MPDPNDVSILASKKYSEEKTINQLAQKVLFVCVCACIYIYIYNVYVSILYISQQYIMSICDAQV